MSQPGRIPTNLFTGFLGTGKTTSILHLLKAKPADEQWAVLVNEFGDVGIDQALIESESPDDLPIQEVGGGCFCCATAMNLPVVLHLLLAGRKVDRLLIETSGLGHPAGILDLLRRDHADRLEPRATIGLVTPSDLRSPGMVEENLIFRQQVELSDVLVLNQADRARPGEIDRFFDWASGLFPPKTHVATAERGQIDPAWLDLAGNQVLSGLSLTTRSHPEPGHRVPAKSPPNPDRGHPARFPSQPDGRLWACGWVFHPKDQFDEEALLQLLGRPEWVRLKGVFHTADGWISINRSAGGMDLRESCHRRDSRLEVFAPPNADWDGLETGLKGCLVKAPQ
jgi:G3E family GTPase